MASYRYVVVDVFTDVPLAGNQLAVFTDARGLAADRMQALALEVGFSETVFVLPAGDEGHASIRIFTPRAELRFAGHPILGTAFVLAAPLQLGLIRLETATGVVPVELERDEWGGVVFGRMRQPVPTVAPAPSPDVLLGALGVERSAVPIELYDNGVRHVYVALENEAAVAALQPDLAALAQYDPDATTCFAGGGSRWKSRVFAPAAGIPEDPATGSAAGPLAVHLARHGWIPFGDQIEIVQGVEINRPSKLYAEAHGTAEEIERVVVGGSAVTVARGEFSL